MRTTDTEGTIRYTVRIPKNLYAKVSRAAKAERTTKAWQILHALYERFDRPKKGKR